MQENREKKTFSASNPDIYSLTKLNDIMSPAKLGSLSIPIPVCIFESLFSVYTKCVEILKSNITIVRQLLAFWKSNKLIKHSIIVAKEDKSDEIYGKIEAFLETYSVIFMAIPVQKIINKLKKPIKQWNAVLRKLYITNQINLTVYKKYLINEQDYLSWFITYVPGECKNLDRSLAQTAPNTRINEILVANKYDPTKLNNKKFEEAILKIFSNEFDKMIKYMESTCKNNQETKKDDSAKTAITHNVVKTIAILTTAKTFLKNASDAERLGDMKKQLFALANKAGVGDLENPLNTSNESYKSGVEQFENMLPPTIKKNYGNDKTFYFENDKDYVTVFTKACTDMQTTFNTAFTTLKKAGQTLEDKINASDKKVKEHVQTTKNTQNIIINAQEKIRNMATQFNITVNNIPPDILSLFKSKIDDVYKAYSEAIKKLGKIVEKNRVERRRFLFDIGTRTYNCQIANHDNLYGTRDAARQNLYQLNNTFNTTTAQLKNGEIPNLMPMDINALCEDTIKFANEYKKLADKAEIKPSKKPPVIDLPLCQKLIDNVNTQFTELQQLINSVSSKNSAVKQLAQIAAMTALVTLSNQNGAAGSAPSPGNPRC